jgi:serine protease Do
MNYLKFAAPIIAASLVWHASTRPARAAEAPESINLRRTVTVAVVEQTKGAVVNISTTKLVSQRIPFGGDPFFQQFDFGQTRVVPAHSLGSGFIVHPDGYVITNNHVIDRARQIQVELSDGRKLDADLISADPEADLAVLKISSDKAFPTLDLGDSSDLLIGEPVIAVGNPLGFSHSVSTGIVSAVHRDLKAPDERVLLGDLIQTDAAINPGNSGGPLLNAYGQVIGINTAIRGDAQNIGFAIQVNKLRELIPELMNPAQVKKLDVPIKLHERRKLAPPATVTSDIEVVGREKESIVAEINGRKPRDIIDAYSILLGAKVNQDVRVKLVSGEELTLQSKPVPLPDAVVQAKSRLGLVVEPMTPRLAEKLSMLTEDGLYVSQVVRKSVAARAGIEPGDVIVRLGRYKVRSLDDFAALMQMLPNEGRVPIAVIRGNQVGEGILEL